MCVFINGIGQTVFTDQFVGENPAPLLLIDGYLYVGAVFGDALYKVNINDPSDTTIVAEFPNDGPWKMVYDDINNDIYLYGFAPPNFSRIDLDQSFPVDPEPLLGVGANGLEIYDQIIYLCFNDEIYTYDIAIGSSSYQLIYTDPSGVVLNPRVYNDELYYALADGPNDNIYKIDLQNPNPQRVLVSTFLNGTVQSSIMVGDYLFLGVETESRILKLDLSSTSYPLSPEVVIDNNNGGFVGLTNDGNTFYASDGATDLILTFVHEVLGVSDEDRFSINIFPNPAKEILHINSSSSFEELKYTIYSVTGLKLMYGNYYQSIDISELPQGLYFLCIEYDGTYQTRKFIKE